MRFSFRDTAGNQYTLMPRHEVHPAEQCQALTLTQVTALIADLAQTAHGRALLDVMNEKVRADTPSSPSSLAQELGITEPATPSRHSRHHRKNNS